MRKAIIVLLILTFTGIVFAETVQRFPRPEFGTGYVPPDTQVYPPRSGFMEFLDVALLVLVLSVNSYFVIKKRYRKGILWVTVFSLIYFGFIRKGCICPIGAIQNVTLALFDIKYILPYTALIFFIIPLFFTLLFGRTFCAGVCPLGAIQDLFLLKPVKIPDATNRILGLLPYIYLAFAILFAATAADFIICRYDPFVGFFRFSGNFPIIITGAGLLILSIFIGRPYCRFLCPYSVILKFVSRFSKWHTTITPSNCIQCKLCENSCAFQAINFPNSGDYREEKSQSIRRVMIFSFLLPVFIFAGGFSGYLLHDVFSRVHKDVRLAEEMFIRKNYEVNAPLSIDAETFQKSGKTLDELYKNAGLIKDKYKKGGAATGAFLGFILGSFLIGLSRNIRRTDYEPDKENCISCGRCYKYCPVEKEPGMEPGIDRYILSIFSVHQHRKNSKSNQ
jgi:NosR/NirI family nitrous oxide reductase transcriptional regulator